MSPSIFRDLIGSEAEIRRLGARCFERLRERGGEEIDPAVRRCYERDPEFG